MESSSITHKLMECGRIFSFSNTESKQFFIINCVLCNADYSEWAKFADHFRNVHQLEDIEHKQANYTSSRDEKSNTVKLHLENNKIRVANQFEDDISQYLDDKMSICKEGENILDKEITNDLDYKNGSEYLSIDCFGKHKNSLVREYKDKLTSTSRSCFFRLCTTDSEVMFKFIELLRKHPCQWDPKNTNFTLKEKRYDSTLNLTKELNETLDINVTPQGTRASILSLLRWFDREYIRYLNCQKKDFQFLSSHKKYFDKLLEFLPYKHLKPMSCNKCSKHFKSEHLLMAHRHKYHNGQVPFHCRYCGHGFIHQSSHKIHENRHVKVHVWPCKICRHQATSKSDYIKHLATHSSHQPHKCSICGLAYKTKTNLNVHLKSHSLPNYECEFCKKKFYEKYRYKRHIWQHEKQEMSRKSIDNYTCEICDRRFTSHKTLMKHQLVHVQENYKIENNSKSIYKLPDVIVYFCGYCSLEFIYKEAYETHMRLKHDC